MTVSEGFIVFVLDQMDSIGFVHHRRMFGGVGLYFEDLFFGLLADDAVYFKVDESGRNRYEKAGAEPFRPYGEGSVSMSYYEVPPEVLEDRDELRVWALEAIAAAGRKAAGKAGRSRPARPGRKSLQPPTRAKKARVHPTASRNR